MRFAFASVMLLFIWLKPAAADLYRWVDPETGSVKFSSYPPPWYNDAAKQRRAPRVEHIPAGRASPTRVEEPDQAQRPATPTQTGKVLEQLDPQGAAARRSEAQALIEKIVKGGPR